MEHYAEVKKNQTDLYEIWKDGQETLITAKST